MKKLIIGIVLSTLIFIPTIVGCGVQDEGVSGWGENRYASSPYYSRSILLPTVRCYLSLSMLQRIYNEKAEDEESLLNKIDEMILWAGVCEDNCPSEIIEEWEIPRLKKRLKKVKEDIKKGRAEDTQNDG